MIRIYKFNPDDRCSVCGSMNEVYINEKGTNVTLKICDDCGAFKERITSDIDNTSRIKAKKFIDIIIKSLRKKQPVLVERPNWKKIIH